MDFKIVQRTTRKSRLILIDSSTDVHQIPELEDNDQTYIADRIGKEDRMIMLRQYPELMIFCVVKSGNTDQQTAELIRKGGAEVATLLQKQKVSEIAISSQSSFAGAAVLLAEGLALASYQFLKYRSAADKITHPLQWVLFTREAITPTELTRLKASVTAIYKARDLVNEPLNYLSATQLAKEFASMGKQAGFRVTTLQKAQIVREKMGGILAVNRGSIDPPTFTVMEYKPAKPANKKPLVMVGKGIVYDTGGLSLKPTANSMDRMKSDMSGAAVVSATLFAAAQMKLPLHLIALVPATDNRPGVNAYVPGDIIRMYDGTSVEVLNTDAEGRLVLADALQWAKRYDPELVVDFATLTGAASVAIGEYGIVCMGTASETIKSRFRDSGNKQYERLVEYPLWDEYGDLLKSEFADLKNVGGPVGGAITAGKFLQHFTDYPWMHFDIAGVSFSTTRKGYLPAGGTGYGIRMMLDFLINYTC